MKLDIISRVPRKMAVPTTDPPFFRYVEVDGNNQDDPEAKDHYEALRKKAMAQYRDVLRGREEILKAFIAKHGCEPDEVMQVEQRMDDGTTRYWIEKKQKP